MIGWQVKRESWTGNRVEGGKGNSASGVVSCSTPRVLLAASEGSVALQHVRHMDCAQKTKKDSSLRSASSVAFELGQLMSRAPVRPQRAKKVNAYFLTIAIF